MTKPIHQVVFPPAMTQSGWYLAVGEAPVASAQKMEMILEAAGSDWKLVGGFTPTENISQFGWLFPIYGKIKNVPNHQPDIYICIYIYRERERALWMSRPKKLYAFEFVLLADGPELQLQVRSSITSYKYVLQGRSMKSSCCPCCILFLRFCIILVVLTFWIILTCSLSRYVSLVQFQKCWMQRQNMPKWDPVIYTSADKFFVKLKRKPFACQFPSFGIWKLATPCHSPVKKESSLQTLPQFAGFFPSIFRYPEIHDSSG